MCRLSRWAYLGATPTGQNIYYGRNDMSRLSENKGLLLKMLFKQIEHIESVADENTRQLRKEFNRTAMLCDVAAKVIHADTVREFPFFDGDLSRLSIMLFSLIDYISDPAVDMDDRELARARMIRDCADAIIKIADIEEAILERQRVESLEEDANWAMTRKG